MIYIVDPLANYLWVIDIQYDVTALVLGSHKFGPCCLFVSPFIESLFKQEEPHMKLDVKDLA